MTNPGRWWPQPLQGRSHGHHRAILMTASGQVSCPPPGSSYCPLTGLRGRLDDPGQHKLEESLVIDLVEPEPGPRCLDHVDQPPRPFPSDHRTTHCNAATCRNIVGRCDLGKVEGELVGVELVACGLD